MRTAAQNWLLGTLLSLAAVAVVAAGMAWFMHTHERVERQVPLPPRGEAVWNPLYALREALRADGVAAETRQRLQPQRFAAAAGDTVLLHGDIARLPEPAIDALLGWVDAGGHLLLRTPPPEALAEDGVPPVRRSMARRTESRALRSCNALDNGAAAPECRIRASGSGSTIGSSHDPCTIKGSSKGVAPGRAGATSAAVPFRSSSRSGTDAVPANASLTAAPSMVTSSTVTVPFAIFSAIEIFS